MDLPVGAQDSFGRTGRPRGAEERIQIPVFDLRRAASRMLNVTSDKLIERTDPMRRRRPVGLLWWPSDHDQPEFGQRDFQQSMKQVRRTEYDRSPRKVQKMFEHVAAKCRIDWSDDPTNLVAPRNAWRSSGAFFFRRTSPQSPHS